MATADLTSLKQEVFDYVRFSLGDQMVDVELDPEHYEEGLKSCLLKYRQRSANSVEESYGFLTLVKDQQEYFLDDNILEVRQVFRRSVGSSNQDNATQFEPFEAAFVNTYLLQAGRLGGIASYEMWSQYQELSARMFGGWMNFVWEPVGKKLTLVRQIEGDNETILMWLYNQKPDDVLLRDHMALPWIRDFTLAKCKWMLGEARSKFATIVGPAGGTSLNGDALKNEAAQELLQLDEDIKNYVDGGDPMYWVIG